MSDNYYIVIDREKVFVLKNSWCRGTLCTNTHASPAVCAFTETGGAWMPRQENARRLGAFSAAFSPGHSRLKMAL